MCRVDLGGSVHLHPVSRIQRQRGDVAATGLRHDRAGVKKYDLLGKMPQARLHPTNMWHIANVAGYTRHTNQRRHNTTFQKAPRLLESLPIAGRP